MIINEAQRELLVAYQQYTEAALQFLAGKGRFRPRVEEDALDALQAAMQVSLKRLLRVAVEEESNGELLMLLPAAGRIGRTRAVDCPRYAIGAGPSAMFVRNGERELIHDFDSILVEHKIELYNDGTGAAPLFGDLLPFSLDFSSR